eukprot:c21387_g1_i2.p1 GENE.c21387_g1_i2~~c21387_g1_i2.p1  ORF type:complete len:853 (-),score=331.88 c21387_g1_i2:106-2664(-)
MEIVVPLIQSTLSSNTNTRNAAEARLQELCNQNFASYAGVLAQILVVEEIEAQVRQSAGLILKNILSDKDAELEAQPWNKLDPNVRLQIKGLATQALGSHSIQAGKSAAQVVSKIGLIELSTNQWPELIPLLLQNVTSTSSELKIASLETIGYICDEIDPSVVSAQSNQILTAVIQGMRATETDLAVRLSATKALNNALVFVKKNFENQQERNFIMMTIFETCVVQAGSEVVSLLKLAAYECLIKVAEFYYDYLKDYMAVIAQLTFNAIQSEEETIGRMAIEFWCTIGDEEMDLIAEEEYAGDQVDQLERRCLKFMATALPSLLPMLLEKMKLIDEDSDDDNIATSAGTCLSIISNTAKDLVIPIVVPFIQTNVQSTDWRLKASAISAFGFILEGPSSETITPLIQQALGFLLQSMKDNHEKTKKSASWTLGRVCEFHAPIIQLHMPTVLTVLVQALSDEPPIASNACWAIYYLVQEFGSQDGVSEQTNIFSQFFAPLLQELLKCTQREDLDEANLRIASYEVINAIIRGGADDTLEYNIQLIQGLMGRLAQTFQMTAQDKEEQYELQGLLIGVFTSIIHRLGARIEPFSQGILQLLLQVFSQRSASVHEEGLMALSAMILALGPKFAQYTEPFMGVVKLGLQNHQESEVCNIAVGVVGDLTRSLDRGFEKYSNDIVTILLQDISDPRLDNYVKPPIFAVLGDIALAVRGKFVSYLGHVMPLLFEACALQVDGDEDDRVSDYLNQLRQSLLDAFVGILQGLNDDKRIDTCAPYLEKIFQFIRTVALDDSKDEDVLKTALSLLGDLCRFFQHSCTPFVKDQSIISMVKEGIDNELQEAYYAKQQVSKLIGGGW